MFYESTLSHIFGNIFYIAQFYFKISLKYAIVLYYLCKILLVKKEIINCVDHFFKHFANNSKLS